MLVFAYGMCGSFTSPLEIDLKGDGTNGLKCPPKHLPREHKLSASGNRTRDPLRWGPTRNRLSYVPRVLSCGYFKPLSPVCKH